MKDIKMVVFVKDGKSYNESLTITDEKEVYESLASDLINKKICNCAYIKRIERYSNYDGTQTIKVFYDNNVKRIYTVKN